MAYSDEVIDHMENPRNVGCQGCSSANDTVKNAATELIKTRFPGIKDIQDVTDHAAGESPYYK